MTTLEEISSCPLKNYEFWSDDARFMLALYRQYKDSTYPQYRALIVPYRKAFIKRMKQRREQEYLIKDKQPWPLK